MGPPVIEQAPAVVTFRARMKDHHLVCGAPPYRSLAEVSRQLPHLYPEALRDRVLPRLSMSTISAVLNGRRVGLPPAEWVTAFVLSCQRRAFETCVLAADPGPEILPNWTAWYLRARADISGS